jgi:hypothetical protein
MSSGRVLRATACDSSRYAGKSARPEACSAVQPNEPERAGKPNEPEHRGQPNKPKRSGNRTNPGVTKTKRAGARRRAERTQGR